MELYEKCERKDLPKQLGSKYVCAGEWLYKFPIGDGAQELNPVCKDCPHYAPGVKMIV